MRDISPQRDNNTGGRGVHFSEEEFLREVQRRVRALDFGSVKVVVHQGRVTEILTEERTRKGE